MSAIGEFLRSFSDIFRWWVVIVPWERAIRVRAGKKKTELGPGFHLRIPYIDRVFKQSIRTRVTWLPRQDLTTSDGKTLTLQGQLGYEISDITKLYEKLHHAEDTVKGMACSAIAEYVTAHTAEECAPRVVEAESNKNFSLRKYGMAGTKISIVNFTFVKTYRLVTGGSEIYGIGDALETDAEEG